MVFTTLKVLCMGQGSSGQLGTDATANVSGSGPSLAAQPLISFSDSEMPIASAHLGDSTSCVVRCDGKVICFGHNFSGQLGQDSTASQGGSPGNMSLLKPIAFNAANIPTSTPLCAAWLIAVTETSGQLTSTFNSLKTFYVIAVPSTIESFAFVAIHTWPIAATVSVNDGYPMVPVPLTTSALTPVRCFLIFFFFLHELFYWY